MSTVEEIENSIRPVLAQNRFELVETQFRRESGSWVLRVFIDKIQEPKEPAPDRMQTSSGALEQEMRSGVTLSDCEKVTELLGNVLDESGIIGESYVLEVSSPGINRALKNEAHFRRFIGQKVKVSLFAPLFQESRQKNFSGILTECENNQIEVQDSVAGKVKIPIPSISKAHLDLI